MNQCRLMRKAVAAAVLLAAVACGEPLSETKGKYRIQPDAGYKESSGQNRLPQFLTVDGVKYRCQYGINFDNADEARFDEEWLKSCTPRRSTYWLPDTVFLEDGKLVVATQVKTGNQAVEILKNNLSEQEFAAVQKPEQTPTAFGGEKKAAVSGAVEKKQQDLYGLFAARIRMKKDAPGHWNAYWLYGVDPKEKQRAYEFDIFEYPRLNNCFDSTTHWPFGDERTSTTQVHETLDIREWNVYALLWTEEAVAYYCNWELICYFTSDKKGRMDEIVDSTKRKQIFKAHQMISPIPMSLIFSNEVGGIDIVWAGVPDVEKLEKSYDSMQVDWYAHYTTNELKAAAQKGGVVYGDYVNP